MQSTGAPPDTGSAGSDLADALSDRCVRFLHPYLVHLDARLDARLVRTVASTVIALIRHRDRPLALLLSELGAILAGPTHAPAGTKRLANLLHSRRWEAATVTEELLTQGQAAVTAAAAQVPEGRALCILDGSVVEKPESAQAEGLAPVRSAKARRLARPRPKLGPGYWRGKPGGPIVVPGWQWLAALITPWAGPRQGEPLTLGAWHWYSHPTRADRKPSADAGTPTATEPAASADGAESAGIPRQTDREAERAVLEQVVAAWGAERLLHVWDRGFAGGPWLGEVLDRDWHFVVRWKKGNHLRPVDAPTVGDPAASFTAQERDGIPAWRLTAGLRPWGAQQLPDPRTGQPVTVRYAARPVRLVHRDEPLWLVVVRLGRDQQPRRGGREPWRLLTTEPVTTERACWRIVEAYAARWQIEQTLRFGKSELGIESVRVRRAAPRHKLLALVSLAYAFLLSLLPLIHTSAGEALLRWAHRTGTRNRLAVRPLYRLRAALAALWHQHTPNLQGVP
jgi:hypothetical protein